MSEESLSSEEVQTSEKKKGNSEDEWESCSESDETEKEDYKPVTKEKEITVDQK